MSHVMRWYPDLLEQGYYCQNKCYHPVHFRADRCLHLELPRMFQAGTLGHPAVQSAFVCDFTKIGALLRIMTRCEIKVTQLEAD